LIDNQKKDFFWWGDDSIEGIFWRRRRWPWLTSTHSGTCQMIFKSEHTRQALSIRFVQAFIYFCVRLFYYNIFVFKTFFSLSMSKWRWGVSFHSWFSLASGCRAGSIDLKSS
jgi:hypothetical protein